MLSDMGFLFGHRQKKELKEHRIAINGTTCNMDGYAAVRAENKQTYLLWGMDAWNEGWINHPIKVIGDLGEQIQGYSCIKDAVVQLLK